MKNMLKFHLAIALMANLGLLLAWPTLIESASQRTGKYRTLCYNYFKNPSKDTFEDCFVSLFNEIGYFRHYIFFFINVDFFAKLLWVFGPSPFYYKNFYSKIWDAFGSTPAVGVLIKTPRQNSSPCVEPSSKKTNDQKLATRHSTRVRRPNRRYVADSTPAVLPPIL